MGLCLSRAWGCAWVWVGPEVGLGLEFGWVPELDLGWVLGYLRHWNANCYAVLFQARVSEKCFGELFRIRFRKDFWKAFQNKVSELSSGKLFRTRFRKGVPTFHSILQKV